MIMLNLGHVTRQTFNMNMHNFQHEHVQLSTWTCTTLSMVMQLSTCFLIGKLNFPNLALTDFLEFFTSKFVFTDFWGFSVSEFGIYPFVWLEICISHITHMIFKIYNLTSPKNFPSKDYFF